MKAVIATDFAEGSATLRFEDIPSPGLAKGEVRIEVDASSLHPADVMMIAGTYRRGAEPPFRTGLSGVGRVREARGTVMGRLLIGRRVVFAFPKKRFGAWAEEAVTVPSLCAPVPDALTDAAAVNLLTNGATAVGVCETLRKGGHRGAVITAAAGDLGRLLRHHLRTVGMHVVCIVRSTAQVELLLQDDESHVLDITDPNFDQLLAEMCARLSITAAIDSISGSMPEHLVSAMPANSTIWMLGQLSGRSLSIDAMDRIIGRDTTITGFNVEHWFAKKSILTAFFALRKATKLLIANPPPPPRFEVGLEELIHIFPDAITNTTTGKTLIRPFKK